MSDHDNSLNTLVGEYRRGQIDRGEFLRRAALLGLSASAAASLLAAPAATASASSRVLRYGPLGTWGNYDPATNNSDGWQIPFATIYESLRVFKLGTTQPVNVLAESIDTSSDGKKIAFTLKRGIQFHHGYGEMTAEDVKYSYERAAGFGKLYPDAKAGNVNDTSWYPGDFQGLQQVKVTGKYSGVIIFKQPFAPFFSITLPYSTSGMIISKKAVEKLGRNAWIEDPVGGLPVGTGPYMVVSHTPNKEAVLQRFTDYSGAASALAHSFDWDEIRIIRIPSTGMTAGESLTVPLQAGDVDFTPGLGSRLAKPLAGNANLRTYARRQVSNYNFITLNVQHPNLKDIRVRQAIRYAVDVPSIIAVFGESQNSRIYGCVPPALQSGYWPDAPGYDRDLDKAKHLMQQAGVSALKVDLEVSSGGAYAKPQGELIQANLADIGITANVLLVRPKDWVTNVNRAQITLVGYLGGPDPYYNLEWFSSSQIKFWNWAFWANPEYDRLLAQLGLVVDPKKRTQIAIRMQQLMDQSAGFIWLNAPTEHAAGSLHVKPAFDWDGNEALHLFKAV
jgi:peptide/nickel transport system substrate-binding protein